MTDTIRDGLKRGEKIRINGFGVFETARREAWRGRNPRTGEAVEVPALTSVRFRPGKGFCQRSRQQVSPVLS